MKLKFGAKEESEIANMIAQVPLFSGIEKKKLKAMAETFTERKYDTGEVIEKEGDMGVAFYLVKDGSVEIQKGKKTIAKLGRGQFFGEMALLDRQPRSASVVASEPTTCLLMTKWNFAGFIQSQPKLALAVMRELARRLRETDQKLSE
jgi:CRP/FNR family cyclic AMP-dependent transcriptional regulator